MNIVIDNQPLQISEIRDVRTVETTPNHFVTVADVLIEGASLPISVDVHAVELASALEPVDESAEIQAAVQMFGGEHTIFEPFSHEDWMDEKRTQEEARY